MATLGAASSNAALGVSAGGTGTDMSNTGGTGYVVKQNSAGANFTTGTIATANIADEAVTYAKMQHVSATDKVLGRSTAGAGDVEEISCTSFGRSLIDDADAGTARTTLGLGNSSTKDVGTTTGTVAAGDDSRFVTNGNSHDHAGGDGAQIDHGGLGGLSDDDHTQYIKHALSTAGNDFLVGSGSNTYIKKTLAETLTILGKAAASGIASLDSSSLVVQNPASAQTTAAASKIPISDGSGKLDTWISDASTSTKGKASFNTNEFSVSSGAVSIKTDGVDDTHIDWGTGTNQVSAVDMPIADAGGYLTATDVEAGIQEVCLNWLKKTGGDLTGPTTISADWTNNATIVSVLSLDADELGTNSSEIYGLKIDVSGVGTGTAQSINARGGNFDIGNNTTGFNMYLVGYGATDALGPHIYGMRSKGTFGSEVVVDSGTNLLRIHAKGWDTNANTFVEGCTIEMNAMSTWSTGLTRQSEIRFCAVPSSSTTLTDIATITGTGFTVLSGTVDIPSGSVYKINSTQIALSDLSNGASHDHSGGDGAAVPESGLSITDVTTGNVTTSAHGFITKAPNNVTQFFRGDATWATNVDHHYIPCMATDFLDSNTQQAGIWSNGAFGAVVGTKATKVTEANHPGIVTFSSSTSANSGYNFATATNCLLLAGGESTDFIFYIETTTDFEARLGFMDLVAASTPNDGAFINISGTTLSGKCYAATSSTTTGTTYTVSASTWYHAKIVVNSDATRIDFYLYNASGTELWTNYITSNIPTLDLGHGATAYSTGTSAVSLLSIDFMNLYINRALTR